MQEIPKNHLLNFNPNTLNDIKKLYNLDEPKRMDEAIDILQEWVHKQDHFIVKDFDRNILERMIICNKGQLERTKQKLDKYCTFRTLLPEYFQPINVKMEFPNLYELTDGILPKLSPENQRVYFCKTTVQKPSGLLFRNYYRRMIIMWEYLQRFDYSVGYIFAYDMRELNLKDCILTVGMHGAELRQTFAMMKEGFGARIQKLVFITDSKLINNLIPTVTPLLSRKVASRITVIDDIRKLSTVIPLDLLPTEYGGNERPLAEIHEAWLNAISSKDHIEYMKKKINMRTDETKRQADVFNDEYLGMPGTFRNFNVD